jgi:hypothetical protein
LHLQRLKGLALWINYQFSGVAVEREAEVPE